MPEAVTRLIKLLRLLHQLITHGVRYVIITSPGLPLTVFKIRTTRLCLNAGQRFSVRISALFPDNISQILCHTKNILHNSRRVFKYIIVYPLQNIGKFVSILCRHINRICFIDMPFSERFHIAALQTKSKSIQRVFQITAAHAVNLSSGRKYHFPCFHFPLGVNLTIGLYHTVQPNMRAAAHIGIVVNHCAAVNQHTVFYNGMCIHHCPLHNKCSISNHCAWAYHC